MRVTGQRADGGNVRVRRWRKLRNVEVNAAHSLLSGSVSLTRDNDVKFGMQILISRKNPGRPVSDSNWSQWFSVRLQLRTEGFMKRSTISMWHQVISIVTFKDSSCRRSRYGGIVF